MILRLENFKLYTQAATTIRYIRRDMQYQITYFSENSDLFSDYHKLNIKYQDFRYVIVPLTIIPRTGLTIENRKKYRHMNLTPYQTGMTPPSKLNLLYDSTLYTKAVDDFYNPKNYRQRAGSMIKNNIYRGPSLYPNFIKILMYSVDVGKHFDRNVVNRKIFPLMKDIKSGNIPFDYMILAIINGEKCKYRLLIDNGTFNFSRLFLFLRNITPNMTEQEIDSLGDDTEEDQVEDTVEDDKVEKTTNKIVNDIKNEIKPENTEKVKSAIKTYVKKDKEIVKKYENGTLNNVDIGKTVVKSVIYKATNNINHAEKVVNKIPDKKVYNFIKHADKLYTDQILVKSETTSTSKDLLINAANVPKLVDNKNPTHLFEKRAIDFENNLRKDIVSSFKVLEQKEIPLKVEYFEIIDKSMRRGEIEPSDISTVVVKLRGINDNVYEILVDIPKINIRNGTFRIGGHTKCLLNQIVTCPISFPKPFDSKFESSYSTFHIYSKETKSKKYLQMYFGSFKKLPLLIVLSYSFGFDNIMKDYDIKYIINDVVPEKSEIYVTRLSENRYLHFQNVNTELKKQLCMSLISENIYKYNLEKEFGDKEYFDDLLQELTGSVNVSYLISNNLENIIDPTTKQVLITKNLPTDLDLIMKYMASRVVEGYTEDRNDLRNQRIRGSEIITYLLYKEMNQSYTVYRQQVLSGNKNAEFNIPRNSVLSTFNTTELVTDMEYANPVEEMASITKISPIGKRVGGIGKVEAVPAKSRNVHDSYFGNIDPLDTPEGNTIGVNQQLSIDADITNARGIFKVKDINDKEKSGVLSTSSSLVPFIGNNEGARVMMADAQIKQILPLKDPEPPIIMTGYETILTSVISDNFVKRAEFNCIIEEVNRDFIIIRDKDGKFHTIDLTPIHLRSGFGRDTLSVFIPRVIKGQRVKKGEIIAEGSCVKDGSLALGRTLLCAYMVYKGYNFEDGIVISEKLVQNEKLTSLHGMIEEVEISEKDRVLYIANIGEYIEKGKPLLRKTIGELEELLGYEEDEGVTVYGQELIKRSPGGRIVDIDVFSNVNIDKYPLLKELSNRTRSRHNMSVNEKFLKRGLSLNGILVKFKIQQELTIGISDKLTGRYGNKGVICYIEKTENLPRTPWGEPVDIVLNPIGIIGRMNVGQLYELYCGLISKDLAVKISQLDSRKKIISLLSDILPRLDVTKNKEYSSNSIREIENMSESKFIDLVTNIRKKGFVPIIVPPFKSPNYKQIMDVLKRLNLQTGYNLYLPEFNTYTKEKVPVGYTYINKLEHMGELKIHSRSTGPVTQTRQPTRGKRNEGGQRCGEADTYSLIGYNATYLLSELMGAMSDDDKSKNEILSEIITTGRADFRVAKDSPARDLMAAFFVQMMLDER